MLNPDPSQQPSQGGTASANLFSGSITETLRSVQGLIRDEDYSEALTAASSSIARLRPTVDVLLKDETPSKSVAREEVLLFQRALGMAATACIGLQHYDHALSLLKEALALKTPDDIAAHSQRAYLHPKIIATYIALRKPAEAFQAYEDLRSAEPKDRLNPEAPHFALAAAGVMIANWLIFAAPEEGRAAATQVEDFVREVLEVRKLGVPTTQISAHERVLQGIYCRF